MNKEQTIEEMAIDVMNTGLPLELAGAIAIDLYEKDYRKVEQGEWRGEIREQCNCIGKKQKYFQPNSCSKCHELVIKRTPYCPHCGSKMKGE